jgi:DNA-binding response OmpR family regulator
VGGPRGLDIPVIMLTAPGEEVDRVLGLELGADVRIHLRARQAFEAGREGRLTRKEFDLLRYLVEHRGEVIMRDRLLDEVCGYDQHPTTRTVDIHILRLRQKFEEDPEHPRHILTAHGRGSRFVG